MKISREEINAIKSNLVAIGLITSFYHIESMALEHKVNKTGLRVYTTILGMLGKNKLFKGPNVSDEVIRACNLESIETLIFEQKFIDFTPLDKEAYMLTIRGAEHLEVMFNLDKGGYMPIAVKINRFFRRLKV